MTFLDFITGIDRDTVLAFILWYGGALILGGIWLAITDWIAD